MLSKMLAHPLLRNIPVGTPDYFSKQQEILFDKPLVKACYDLWYTILYNDIETVTSSGIVLELGSGSSYLKNFIPGLLTSDVQKGIADMVIDARHIPFEDDSLRAICLTHVFHHIPDVRAFLDSASRCLKPGGVIAMVDCADTPLARFFFGRFHPEPYHMDAHDWNFDSADAMLNANQALSSMVFKRDRAYFTQEFPELQIEKTDYLPSLGYLMEGGVTLRNFVPGFARPFVRALDTLSFLRPLTALHWHIRLRKKNQSSSSADSE